MNPDHMTLDPRKGPKTEEEKLFLATDFIKQYYGAMKRYHDLFHIIQFHGAKRSLYLYLTYQTSTVC